MLLGAFGVFQGSFGLLVTRLQRLLAESLPVSRFRANAFQEGYGEGFSGQRPDRCEVWTCLDPRGAPPHCSGLSAVEPEVTLEVAAAAALGLAVPALAVHGIRSGSSTKRAGLACSRRRSRGPHSEVEGCGAVSSIGTSAVISVPFVVLAVLVWSARPRTHRLMAILKTPRSGCSTMHPMSAPETGMARQDLSVTALYTSATWSWGHLPDAELLVHPQAHIVFNVVNAVIALIRPFFPGLAPLRSSLVHRHMMIDRLVATSGARQVLELAAGLSRRGVSLSSDSGLDYTEVDAPHVIEAERKCCSDQSADGRRCGPQLEAHRRRCDPDSAAGPGPKRPSAPGHRRGGALDVPRGGGAALVVQEGCGAFRSAGGTLIFDLVPACEQPSPGAVGRALIWLMERFTGGKAFVRDQRTRDDLRRDVLEAGFADVRLYEPTAVARAWDLPMPDAKTQQLLFVGRVPPLLPVP